MSLQRILFAILFRLVRYNVHNRPPLEETTFPKHKYYWEM